MDQNTKSKDLMELNKLMNIKSNRKTFTAMLVIKGRVGKMWTLYVRPDYSGDEED